MAARANEGLGVYMRTFKAGPWVWLGFLSIAVGANAGAAGGQRTPAAIARAVDSEAASAVELLARMVDINSGTFNRTGVQEIGKVLEAELRALGFQTHWVSMDT